MQFDILLDLISQLDDEDYLKDKEILKLFVLGKKKAESMTFNILEIQ